MQPANIAHARPVDRRARFAQRRRRRSDDRAAGRQREFLQDRLSARLCRRPAAGPPARRSRQEGLCRPQAARHRQYGRARGRERGKTRRHLPHRARLSADHEGGGRGARRIGPEDPCRHRAHILRRRRPACGRLSPLRLRSRRGARPAGAGAWRRRDREFAGRGGRLAQDRRPPDEFSDTRHPPRRQRHRRPEAHHDAGAGDRRRQRLSGGRPADRGSDDPKAAAEAIQAEIAQALV